MLLDRVRGVLDFIDEHTRKRNWPIENYCTRCQASLRLQEGYSPDMRYWTCRSCHQLLINSDYEGLDDGNVWTCDGCGAFLNEQEGFAEDTGRWKCTECGFNNDTSSRRV